MLEDVVAVNIINEGITNKIAPDNNNNKISIIVTRCLVMFWRKIKSKSHPKEYQGSNSYLGNGENQENKKYQGSKEYQGSNSYLGNRENQENNSYLENSEYQGNNCYEGNKDLQIPKLEDLQRMNLNNNQNINKELDNNSRM